MSTESKKRGPKPHQDRPTTIKLRVSTGTLERWKQWAEKHNTTVSDLLRDGAEEKMEEFELEQYIANEKRREDAKLNLCEMKFQSIISAPSSPEYQSLYQQTSEWAKQEGGNDVVNDMRSIFYEQHGIEVMPASSADVLGK